MIKKYINSFKNLEKLTCTIMKKGFKFCFFISLISCIILFTYISFSLDPFIYYIGLSIFKLSLYFMVEFIICGFVVDNIKKQVI